MCVVFSRCLFVGTEEIREQREIAEERMSVYRIPSLLYIDKGKRVIGGTEKSKYPVRGNSANAKTTSKKVFD